MIKRIFIKTLLIQVLIALFLSGEPFAREKSGYHRVKHVIDGDTIVIDTGEHVRYIGMDTPERNEPFYEEAKARNKSLVNKKKIKLVVCKKEPKDKFGRLLAWVYADGVFVNRTLVNEGLARKLIIPPCADEKAAEFEQIEKSARERRIGIWGERKEKDEAVRVIQAEDARYNTGKYLRIKGRINNVYKTRKAIFIDFGAERIHDLSAVIFKKNFIEFESAGIDPLKLKGRVVIISGFIKNYNGRPEVILNRPSQVQVEQG